MNKGQPRHILVWVHFLLSTELKDRKDVLGLDMLSMYDQDDSVQLVFAVKEMLVELNFLSHFVQVGLECQ
jgi:hypothetical protein